MLGPPRINPSDEESTHGQISVERAKILSPKHQLVGETHRPNKRFEDFPGASALNNFGRFIIAANLASAPHLRFLQMVTYSLLRFSFAPFIYLFLGPWRATAGEYKPVEIALPVLFTGKIETLYCPLRCNI